jgi:transcriptional regulator with XRE-family HTH domain
MTNLQEYRKKRNISQRQLAEQTGVNLRTLQDYEQGRKPLGQAAALTVLRIAKALGVTVEDLIK